MKKILFLLFIIPIIASAQRGKPHYGNYEYFDTVKLHKLRLVPGTTIPLDTTNYKIKVENATGDVKTMNWQVPGAGGGANSGDPTNITGLLKGNGSVLSAAVAGTDYATASGIHYEAAVRAATTGAGTLASSFEDGDAIDGVTLATGNRLLIKNQAAPEENGIYTVNASGAPTRATDFDESSEITEGDAVFVTSGTANAGTSWYQQTAGTITVGTTAIVFVQFNNTTVADGSVTDVKVATGIDAVKLADGSVTNTEFQRINSVTSNVQDQIDAKLATSTAASTYAPIASPTFTGTVSGVTAAMVGLGNVDNTSDATKNSATVTLTNKRITPREANTTSSATPTINTDNVDIYRLTAQAVDVTSFSTNLSGTPTIGQILEIWVTGTATRNLTFGASFSATSIALPTSTSGTATLKIKFDWNGSTWSIVNYR